MTQSQTSNYTSSSFPYGGASKGLSIHERERDEAQRRRKLARQLQNAESDNILTEPLFPQPKKIQPSNEDPLQHSIQATLGDFKALAPSINQKLLGVVPKNPQTPVESGNKVFNFDNTSNDKKENTSEKNSIKIHKAALLHQRTTCKTSQEDKAKTLVNNIKPSSKSSLINKKVLAAEHQEKSSQPTKSLSSEEAKSKALSVVKKESKLTSSELPKSDLPTHQNSMDENKKNKSSKKEAKHGTNKLKPPRLSIKDRIPIESTVEGTQLGGKTNNIEKIFKEMTQPVPPISAIHTPLKNNARFAFPQPAQRDSPLGHTFGKKDKEESLLTDDLHLTDDDDEISEDEQVNDKHLSSGSSSDDSDSDSSDSDSDSSGSDVSPLNSPVPFKRSELNKPSSNFGLNHPNTSVSKKTHPPTTALDSSTSSLSLNTIGGEGLRGNQAAPAANTSPLNHSSLNTEIDPSFEKELTDALCNPLEELPDLSKDLLVGGVFAAINGSDHNDFDAILSNGVDHSHSQLIESVHTDKDLSSCIDSVVKPSPKVKDKDMTEIGHTVKPPRKSEKKHKLGNEQLSKSSKEKQQKEQDEKTSKPPVKSKKLNSETGKLKSKENVSSSKNHSHLGKITPKITKTDKVGDKKASKPKKNNIKSTLNGSTLTPTKSSDGENEEIDVVTVSNDKPFSNDSTPTDAKMDDSMKNSTSKSLNHSTNKAAKSSTKLTNGHHKEPINGKMVPPPTSPKNELVKEEITLDCSSKPGALVVKIPLALLKRIPFPKGSDTFVLKVENTDSSTTESQNDMSPSRKATKHHLSVECSETKKVKTDPELNGCNKKKKSNGTNQSSSERNDDTCSSLDENRRKRSPSRESDRHYHKRRRHDSEGQREREKNWERNREKDYENGHSKENGCERTKDLKTPVEHSDTCSCGGKKEAEKRDSWITRFYEAEPKVPRGPDHYLHEAKRVKHHADAIKEHKSRAYKYFEAVLNFVQCGKALEQNNDSESRSAYQMYVETIDMLKYAMRLFANRSHPDKKGDKRFLGLCLRLQSLLYMRLFKLRKDSMLKASKSLLDHFKGQAKNIQAPSPYNVSNPKTTGTPSPMSPTPSPSGSIGSVGSVGSASSNEAMTTPSRTHKVSSNCMTSPVNITVPQKIHTTTIQHLGFTNHMLYGYDAWEQSQLIFNEYKDFFMELDRIHGPITLHSSIVDVVEYLNQGYQQLKETQGNIM